MVTVCHTGPCPLPSPGDELLRSSSHRTLGRGYGAPCRATRRGSTGRPGPWTLWAVGRPHQGLDNVLELGCPGPSGLARTQAENEISLRRKKELDWGETAVRDPARPLLVTRWHVVICIDLSSGRYGAQCIHPSRRREHLSDAKY